MTRSNPLFVDSTKRSTDSIGCCVELRGLNAAIEESVYVKIKSALSQDESSLLKKISDDFYQVKVWLQHQQEVILQFYVMNQNGVIMTSKEYPLKATYAIECEWVKQEKLIEVNESKTQEKLKTSPSTELMLKDFKELSCLIDKWGL